MEPSILVTAAVEGIVDEALLKRVCNSLGTDIAYVYGKGGKSSVIRNLQGYNHSARFRHWVILLDLDRDAGCAPDAVNGWLPAPAPLMRLRVAVRELEAWLLADPERLSGFLGVSSQIMPGNPDNLPDPKLAIVNLARASNRRAVKEDIVPSLRSGHSEGPAYASRMIEFISDVHNGWRPEVAAINSDSFRRCRSAILNLMQQPFPPASSPST